MMTQFDAPDTLQDLPTRSSTTIAPQALMLLNNPVIRGYAESFARRIHPQAAVSVADAVRAGYTIALSRPPSDAELTDTVQFLDEQSLAYKEAGKQNPLELALADFCQTMLCLNEFVYLE